MFFRQEDTFRHKGLRVDLIKELRNQGIECEKVLQAIMDVPRHFFLDPALDVMAYENRAFPISAGQTISQPYTVAFMTELLNIEKYDKVLEIGTGSAYQGCVLAQMGALVYSIERQKELFDRNNKFRYLNNFPLLKRFYGDGFKGLPSFAPFDKIIVTAAAPFFPEAFNEQLKIGGVVVIPEDEKSIQIMKRYTKKSDGTFNIEVFSSFQFVPMLNGTNEK